MSELNIDMTTPEMEELMKKKNDFETLIAKEAEKQRVMISRLDTIHSLHYQLTEANQKLAEAQARDNELAYELKGIAADVDAGNGFDIVCRKTLGRVIEALSESPSNALNEVKATMLEELLSTFAWFSSEEGQWLANSIREMAQQLRENK